MKGIFISVMRTSGLICRIRGRASSPIRSITSILEAILFPIDVVADTLAYYDLIFHKKDLEHIVTPSDRLLMILSLYTTLC